MQGVTNPARLQRWEEAYRDWWAQPGGDRSSEAAVFRAGWDAAIASQAELVAAALAWYDRVAGGIVTTQIGVELTAAIKAYREARVTVPATGED